MEVTLQRPDGTGGEVIEEYENVVEFMNVPMNDKVRLELEDGSTVTSPCATVVSGSERDQEQ